MALHIFDSDNVLKSLIAIRLEIHKSATIAQLGTSEVDTLLRVAHVHHANDHIMGHYNMVYRGFDTLPQNSDAFTNTPHFKETLRILAPFVLNTEE
jgi:hypothetical protein